MAMSVTDNNTLTLLNTMDYLSAQQGAIFRRLCTGSKINRGADDPAGLMALQSINCELIGVDAAIRNNQRSDAMLNVADSALTQLSDLLGQIQTLVAQSSNSAGLTANEIASNQSQIDDAIASIERIVRTTEFNGRNLLDGSLGINVTGANATYFENVRVYSRDPNAASNAVRVTVNGVAQRAKAEGLTTTAASQATTIEVKGRLGTQIIDLKADENLSAVVAKINDVTALTGVYASGTSAGVDLYSKGYGSAEFVKVSILSGDTTHFKELDGAGVDADVTVNGAAASADGNEVYFSQNGLNLAFRITEAFTAGTTQTFEVDKPAGLPSNLVRTQPRATPWALTAFPRAAWAARARADSCQTSRAAEQPRWRRTPPLRRPSRPTLRSRSRPCRAGSAASRSTRSKSRRTPWRPSRRV